MMFFKKIKSLLLKIIKGKDILIVRQNGKKWNEQFKAGKWDFLLNEQGQAFFIADVCSKISRNKDIAILDVGCGNGAIPRAFSRLKFNCRYYGIDVSSSALDKAREYYSQGIFIHADAEEPPEFNAKFDIIIFSEVLFYVDYKKILPLYKKYIKSDGIVIISMYLSWRTRLIWRFIDDFLNYLSVFKISDKIRNQSWIIKVGQFK